jgi:hypothetical protein
LEVKLLKGIRCIRINKQLVNAIAEISNLMPAIKAMIIFQKPICEK